MRGTLINFNHTKSNVCKKCIFCNKKIESDKCIICGKAPKLYFFLTIEIKDFSGHLLINLNGQKAENFSKITPDEYIKNINLKKIIH